MKNDMKLIMESWRSQTLLLEGNPPATVGDFRVALLAATDPDVDLNKAKSNAEEYVKLYNKVNGVKPTRDKLKLGMAALGVLAAGIALAPVSLPVGVAAAVGTATAAAGFGSAFSTFVGDLIEKTQDKKIQDKDSIRVIMDALGIDSKLLATIENDIEDKFFQDVIQPKLEDYFNKAAPNDPLPNLTSAFQQYLNTNQASPLSDAESDSKVAPK